MSMYFLGGVASCRISETTEMERRNLLAIQNHYQLKYVIMWS